MTNVNQPQSLFAQKKTEAWERFNEYRSKDPFPRIAPALLNSADIHEYVAKTGMIYPFYPNKLKSASYRVSILGKLVYWDDQDRQQIQNIIPPERIEERVEQLDEKKQFTLSKNSISFVTLEPIFLIPDYIALRFNLKIQHIYKGLLLGTGPLVDPGFTGRLSIPLHNLTNNDYVFSAEDELIEMEFTKLSPNKRWRKSIIINSIKGNYKEFRNDPDRDVEYYLNKAIKSATPLSIRSSIPEVFKNAEQASKNATDTVKFFQRAITIGGIVSALLILLTLWALWFQVYALVEDSVYYVNTAQKDLNTVQTNINSFNEEINSYKSKLKLIDKYETQINFLENEIESLKSENAKMQAELSKLK